MNTKFSLALVLLVLTGWVSAELPRKAPLTKYSSLWLNSPFTTKPIQADGPPPANPLDDYSLLGVSPIKGGYRVTIINKKNPDERKFVYSDQPNASHGFKIVSVDRKPGDMRGTVVRMKSGEQEGSVAYDDKFLTIAAPPPVQQPPGGDRGRGRGKVPPGVNPNPANPNNAVPAPPQPGQPAAPRAPRPRVIGPPPAPQSPQPQINNGNPNSSGQRPLRR